MYLQGRLLILPFFPFRFIALNASRSIEIIQLFLRFVHLYLNLGQLPHLFCIYLRRSLKLRIHLPLCVLHSDIDIWDALQYFLQIRLIIDKLTFPEYPVRPEPRLLYRRNACKVDIVIQLEPVHVVVIRQLCVCVSDELLLRCDVFLFEVRRVVMGRHAVAPIVLLIVFVA